MDIKTQESIQNRIIKFLRSSGDSTRNQIFQYFRATGGGALMNEVDAQIDRMDAVGVIRHVGGHYRPVLAAAPGSETKAERLLKTVISCLGSSQQNAVPFRELFEAVCDKMVGPEEVVVIEEVRCTLQLLECSGDAHKNESGYYWLAGQ
jgi:hypothetical protein